MRTGDARPVRPEWWDSGSVAPDHRDPSLPTDARHRSAARVAALLLAAAGVVAACSDDSSSSAVTTTTATSSALTTATTTATPSNGGVFVSTTYGYTIRSPLWSGLGANASWDGTGSPGSADPTVDRLYTPDNRLVFAYGGPTDASLPEFVADSRSTAAAARDCPVKPEATRRVTISGEPGVVDETHCNGVFALSAFVVHAGRAVVFFTFDQPGHEAAMRRLVRLPGEPGGIRRLTESLGSRSACSSPRTAYRTSWSPRQAPTDKAVPRHSPTGQLLVFMSLCEPGRMASPDAPGRRRR